MSDVIENNERKSNINIKACLSMTFQLGMPCKGEKEARWILFFLFWLVGGWGQLFKIATQNEKANENNALKRTIRILMKRSLCFLPTT